MDMKRILQAFDDAGKKPTEGAADMKRFVSIVNESNFSIPQTEPVSTETASVGSQGNSFLLAADKINDAVMAEIEKIKNNADPDLVDDLMNKFNDFMTAYHSVGKEIVQPDLFKDSAEEQFTRSIANEGLSFKDYAALAEAKKKMSAKDDPCWKGYKMVGTKQKGGKEVPNCVPGKKGD